MSTLSSDHRARLAAAAAAATASANAGGGVHYNVNTEDWDDDDDEDDALYVCCYDKTMGETMQQSAMSSVQPGLDAPQQQHQHHHLPRLHHHHLPPLLDGRPLAAAAANTPGGLLGGLGDAFPAQFSGSRGKPSASYFNSSGGDDPLDYNEPDHHDADVAVTGTGEAPASYGSRKRTRSSNSSRQQRYGDLVDELGAEEVRWFYKEDKKTWKPFVGHDSLKIELSFRKSRELNSPRPHAGTDGPAAAEDGGEGGERAANGLDGRGLVNGQQQQQVPVESRTSSSVHLDRGSLDSSSSAAATVFFFSEEEESDAEVNQAELQVEHVCVRGGLYEVDAKGRQCYPVYWNRTYHRVFTV
ncbi:hypothetical protein CRUP_014495 [Coryphaenoides rupestris]|nr:hypothetical protein CRUP_014495 [Coryphaenoides rupestris]